MLIGELKAGAVSYTYTQHECCLEMFLVAVNETYPLLAGELEKNYHEYSEINILKSSADWISPVVVKCKDSLFVKSDYIS